MDTELIEARLVESALSGIPCYEYIASALATPWTNVLVITHAPTIAYHELKQTAPALGWTAYSNEREMVFSNSSRLRVISQHPEKVRRALIGNRYDVIWFMNVASLMAHSAAMNALTAKGRILEGHIR